MRIPSHSVSASCLRPTGGRHLQGERPQSRLGRNRTQSLPYPFHVPYTRGLRGQLPAPSLPCFSCFLYCEHPIGCRRRKSKSLDALSCGGCYMVCVAALVEGSDATRDAPSQVTDIEDFAPTRQRWAPARFLFTWFAEVPLQTSLIAAPRRISITEAHTPRLLFWESGGVWGRMDFNYQRPTFRPHCT